MSQTSGYSTHADGVPLMACTKCNTRHPFEDLSQSQQLCRNCLSSYHVIRCKYCRIEFHREITSSSSNSNGGSNKHTSSICTKCRSLADQNGKPRSCAYCQLEAAFIGSKCQRCSYSEKKYGAPKSCENCKQKSAFVREDPESKKKVDGKLLCWLCTMAYKRTLTRAKQKEAAKLVSKSSGQHRSSTTEDNQSSTRRHHHSTSSRHHNSSSNPTEDINGSSTSKSHQRSSLSSHNHRHHSSSHGSGDKDRHESSLASSNKKQRLDGSNPMQLSSASTSTNNFLTDNRFIEPGSSRDMTTVVEQLKEKVADLNRKIQVKDQDLMTKNQQIAELKATITRDQRETKEKLNSIQKQHAERISEMQAKIITMQKQIASQTKAARANVNNHKTQLNLEIKTDII